MGGWFSSSPDLLAESAVDDAREQNRPKTIYFIEGNISAGKTTLIKNLRKHGFKVFEEGVDALTKEYVDEKGENILSLFYGNMKKYAFQLQIASLEIRWKIIKEAIAYLDPDKEPESNTQTVEELIANAKSLNNNNGNSNNDDVDINIDNKNDGGDLRGLKLNLNDIVFVERSLLTDRHSFALNLFEQGSMTKLEWKIYTDSLTSHIADVQPHFQGINLKYIYIRTEPDECYRRKIQRGRVEESEVPIGYFRTLHLKNDQWLRNGPLGSDDIHIINGNKSEQDIIGMIFYLLVHT